MRSHGPPAPSAEAVYASSDATAILIIFMAAPDSNFKSNCLII